MLIRCLYKREPVGSEREWGWIMTNTRAKFVVTEKTELKDGYKVKLNTVYTGSDEDKAFWKFTPFGEITMGLVMPETAAQFKVGSSYYVDFAEIDVTA